IYPHSIFLMNRLGVILEDLGKNAEAEAFFKKAEDLDPEQSVIWREYIENGAAAATKKAFKETLPPVMNLVPNRGIYAIQAEREIRFPEEKFVFPTGQNRER